MLLADEGQRDQAIADTLHGNASTMARTHQKFIFGGLEVALNERPGARRLWKR